MYEYFITPRLDEKISFKVKKILQIKSQNKKKNFFEKLFTIF